MILGVVILYHYVVILGVIILCHYVVILGVIIFMSFCYDFRCHYVVILGVSRVSGTSDEGDCETASS